MEMLLHFNKGAILNIDKPTGWTSFDVVKKVRKLSTCRKVGHAGSLDPMATGVLLICIGKATKSVNQLMNLDKEYEAEIRFGCFTDTDDSDGQITYDSPVPDFKKEDILDVLEEFLGDIDQIPPMYSAIKQNGKRLYKLARQGITVERKPRRIRIFKIDLIKWEKPFLKCIVQCSKGTYIRALARDLGYRLNCGAYLTQLRRLRIGPYKIDDALSIDQVKDSIFNDASDSFC